MALDRKNTYMPEVQVVGMLHRAPLGTALPVSARAPLGPEYIDMGYVEEDGFSPIAKRETNALKCFGGKTIRKAVKSYDNGLKITLVETMNADVLIPIFGEENVIVTPATATTEELIEIHHTGSMPGFWVWVLTTKDGKAQRRWVWPNAEGTELGDVKVKGGEAIKYELTIDAYDDETGKPCYEHIAKGVFAAA